MAAFRRRVSLALFLAVVLAVCAMAFAGPAFAVGEDGEHALDLGPYLGSSLTTDLIVGGVSGSTGSYCMKVELQPGQTFRADFTPAIDTANLKALTVDEPIIGSITLPSGVRRLTFTADTLGMFQILAAASSGGTFTVAPSISLTTSRLYGADRIATAIAVSQRSYPAHASAVVIAYAYNFPDALAAAPLAKAYGGPVLLTSTASLRDDVIAELERLQPSQVFIVGSSSVVSNAVQTRLGALTTHPAVTRLGGATRYETAALIAGQLRSKAGKPSRVVVVNGDGYPDALSAAPLAAAKGWPILLTGVNALPSATASAVAGSGAGASLVVGSEAVVSKAVADSLPSAFRAGGRNRYETCALVADFAVGQGCSYDNLGLATGANYPDALAAGPYLAQHNGLLLLSDPSGLSSYILTRLTGHKANGARLDVIGASSVVPTSVVTQAQTALN